jgi:hypothetical protein
MERDGHGCKGKYNESFLTETKHFRNLNCIFVANFLVKAYRD